MYTLTKNMVTGYRMLFMRYVDLLYLHACHRVGGMLPGARHYETLVLFC